MTVKQCEMLFLWTEFDRRKKDDWADENEDDKSETLNENKITDPSQEMIIIYPSTDDLFTVP